jgi:hypothetical protein
MLHSYLFGWIILKIFQLILLQLLWTLQTNQWCSVRKVVAAARVSVASPGATRVSTAILRTSSLKSILTFFSEIQQNDDCNATRTTWPTCSSVSMRIIPITCWQWSDPAGHTCLAYTPNGRKLITAGSNDVIRVYTTGSDGEPTNIDDCPENNTAIAATVGKQSSLPIKKTTKSRIG